MSASTLRLRMYACTAIFSGAPSVPAYRHLVSAMKRPLPVFLFVAAVLLACGLGEKAEQLKQITDAAQEAAKQAEESGNPQDALSTFLGGGERVEPVDFRALRDLLPERLDDLPRADVSGQKGGAMGVATSEAQAVYRTDATPAQITLKVMDLGSVKGMMAFGLAWLQTEIDRETADGYERTTDYRDFPAHEKVQGRNAELSLLAYDRFVVSATGRDVTMAQIKDAVDRIDFGELDDLKEAGVGAAADPAVADRWKEAAEQAEARQEAAEARQQALADGASPEDAPAVTEPVDFRAMRDLLPRTVGRLERTNASGEKTSFSGVGISQAEGRYEAEGANLTIKVQDMGAAGGAAFAFPWLMVEVDKESDTGFERTTTFGRYPAYETYRTDREQGELKVLIGNRFLVDVQGRGVSMETLHEAVEDLGPGRLAALGKVGV